MDEITIREAGPADLEVIVHHRRAMFEDMGYKDAAALEAMDRSCRPFFKQALAEGTYRSWLAQNTAAEVVAGGGILILPWPGHPRDTQTRRPMIVNVYTEPAWRRCGLARRLMVAMLDWLRQEGYGTVSLHASDYGRSLYESLGFQATNEMRLQLKDWQLSNL
ncbi:MAG TPA: GNAT family N-acetyltransferase [Terriglobales bacterium]|jgi:GNAT superfamily N-acetyltransferase|nr:GNAT family N-acetyltransferase [Terriglobales bacterium]